MDRLTLAVLLQHQDTGTFLMFGVVLNHDGIGNAGHNISYKNTISSQFIIAMARYENLSLASKLNDPLKCFTHNSTDIL